MALIFKLYILRKYDMKKTLTTFALSLMLTACGGSDSKSNVTISENSYAVQMVASDFGSSQVAVGNITGDRTATQGIMGKSNSDYTISTYQHTLYHIGKNTIDTIDSYNANESLRDAISSYSANDNGSGSANTYRLLHSSDDNAYLIRYGSNSILQINPNASSSNEFSVNNIDLSAYTVEGSNAPKMVDAAIYNNQLFVAMQRLDNNWVANQAYIAVIDISDPSNPQEIDTDPQSDGLKGIPLNARNTFTLVEHNGFLYAAGRGDYSNDNGGLDKIDASTYAVTSLIGSDDFSELNNTEENIYYHVTGVAIIDDQTGYVTLNIESGFDSLETKLVSFDPETGSSIAAVDFVNIIDKEIKTIKSGPDSKLWIGISNSENPGIIVLDTDTNTINDEFISLEMPPIRIEFLSTDNLATENLVPAEEL